MNFIDKNSIFMLKKEEVQKELNEIIEEKKDINYSIKPSDRGILYDRVEILNIKKNAFTGRITWEAKFEDYHGKRLELRGFVNNQDTSKELAEKILREMEKIKL